MAQISLTDLVDIVSKSGTPKANKVLEVKTRPDYDPAFDFYKPLRDRIVDLHKNDESKSALTAFLATVTDPKKRTNYPTAITGYRKWWGRKSLTWFPPPRANYAQHGVEVMVNPELGLDINGVRHLVKLYFKSEPLSKLRIDVITRLMETTLRPQCTHNETIAVLDVRQAKMFQFQGTAAASMAMINAELAYIASLWAQP